MLGSGLMGGKPGTIFDAGLLRISRYAEPFCSSPDLPMGGRKARNWLTVSNESVTVKAAPRLKSAATESTDEGPAAVMQSSA